MQVLVVSRDAAERDAVAQSLGNAVNGRKVMVLWAQSVDECLEQIKGNQVDSIIFDEKVAEPAKALAQVRATHSKLPVIVFGDTQDEKEVREVMRLGAAEVMSRADLRTPRIAGAVTRILERSSSVNDSILGQISDFALSMSQEGAFAFDQHYRVMLWNPAMEQIFGLKKEQMMGKKATELVPFLFTDTAAIQKAQSGQTIKTAYHDYLVFQNGRRGIYQAIYGPLKGASGDVIGIIALVRDVADKAANDRSLNEAHERINLLLNAVPNLVWISDQSNDRIYFNDKWLQFTGRSLSQEQGRGWMENVHPQDMPRFVSTYSQAVKSCQGYHVEYRLRRSDGQYRLILESGVPQHMPSGQFFGYMGSCTDISETRLTQQKLTAIQPAKEKSIEHLTSTLDHAPIAIWKLDESLVISKANPAVASQLGVDPESLVGMPFNELVPSVPDSIFAAVLERGDRVQLESHPVIIGSGDRRRQALWDLAAWPLKDKANRVVGVCVSTTEVTEREMASQQREDFVATLVHDLKTPLIGADRTLEQIINGALGSLDPGQQEVLSMLKRSNYQLVVMVQNLIEVYRYEAGQPSLAFEELDLYQLLRDCVLELQALGEFKGVSIAENFPAPSAMISADRLAIRRVFLNLLDNALKFTPKGGKILLSGQEDVDSISVFVRDTGIGISKEDYGKLFQRFWQGETGKRYAPGTGLGLYLCRQIVAAHDGRITVASKEYEGTTFTVVLPKLGGARRQRQ